MTGSSVVHLRPARSPDAPAADAPRLMQAFAAALLRSPPRPNGIAACVAYLQEPTAQLLSHRLGLRALQNLRASLFVAPGRDAEMDLLWREAVATACNARIVARLARFDAPLLTGTGLLHRAGEIAALRALASAEATSGQRLAGPVMREILEARDDELVARVTRSWSLPCELRQLVLRWRGDQESLKRCEAVTLLTMAQALATELVHADTCTPGLVDAAREALRLPAAMVEQARGEAAAIRALATAC